MLLRSSRWSVIVLLLALVTISVTACGSNSADSGDTASASDPSPTKEPPVATEPAVEPSPTAGADTPVEAVADQATALYHVPTITCPSCGKRVEANARKDPGVVEVEVDLSTQNVSVVYDPAVTDAEQIAEAIRAGGDNVIPKEQE